MILDRPCREERRIVIKQCRGPVNKMSWLPRRCFLTGKWLFMKKAVQIGRTFTVYPTGNKLNMTQYFWVDSKEYLLLHLGA